MKVNLCSIPEAEYRAICEIAPELGIEFGSDGLNLSISKGDLLSVDRTGDDVKIIYNSIPSLLRAVALMAENASDENYSVTERLKVDILAPMIDQSRNAVMRPEALKRFIRKIALMGYNAVQLYTEDTYTLENYPYFGHFRGRYTDSELIEIRDYCAMLGIELIPCIQTLAHLNAIFHWHAFSDYRDTGDILRVGAERVYELIDEMLSHFSSLLPSRRINIGMDEAHMLGRGAYLDENGYSTRPEIMEKHLKKVAAMCEKYGYRPMMWSDMFFRMQSPKNEYYYRDMVVTDEIRSKVPDNVTLVYWDYYSQDAERYDYMFEHHRAFGKKFSFAGGTSSWYGVLPLNTYAADAARIAMQSALKAGTSEIYVTMWGDNGATCSNFSVFSTLQIYAELAYGEKGDDKNVARRMKTCTGADYKDFLSVEQIADLPTRTDFGKNVSIAWRYMLWQDVLMGQFDLHVPDGSSEHFAKCAGLMKRCRSRAEKNGGEYTYIFDTFAELCNVLELKAELGKQLKSAYDAGDREALANIADKIIPALIKRVEKLHRTLRKQWMQENKPEGFDVQDIRFGGLEKRLESVRITLHDYLDGKIGEIEELTLPRLYYSGNTPALQKNNNWASMVTVNVI